MCSVFNYAFTSTMLITTDAHRILTRNHVLVYSEVSFLHEVMNSYTSLSVKCMES